MNAFAMNPDYQHVNLPEWFKTAVFYQLYPQSFNDSNGDGIGDLNGITEKLDYIAALGVDAIWLNPIYPSPFQDAGYDVMDYCDIAPRYGTKEDFQRLIKEAEKRGLRIVLDLVAGHTSDQHPWFKASATGTPNTFSDRYVWAPHNKGKSTFMVKSTYPRSGYYLKNFFDCQPALNYGFTKPDPQEPWQQSTDAAGPKATKTALREIMQYWLDLGVSGFRVDMALSLVKNDHDHREVQKLWRELKSWMKQQYPEAILIAEGGNPEVTISAGYDADFMIHFGVPGYPALFFNETGTFTREEPCFFDRRGRGCVMEFVKNFQEQWQKIGTNGLISVPTANHDFQRPNCGVREQVAELKVVMAFILTWPGLPVIYYGDEIGMRFLEGMPDKEGSTMEGKYNRAGTRTPMQWDNTKSNAGFSTQPDPEKIYLPIDPNVNRPDVASQEADPDALLNFTRQLLKLRKNSPALGNCGQLKIVYAKPQTYPFVYLRQSGEEKYLIALNPAEKPVTVKLDLPTPGGISSIVSQNANLCEKNGKLILEMTGVSFGIFKLL